MRALLLTLALAAGAAAQPSPDVAGDAAPPLPADAGGITPFAATALSLGATAAGVGLGYATEASVPIAATFFVGGLFVAPSTGNIAQGEWRDVAHGAGARLLGATTALAGVGLIALEGEQNTNGIGGAVVVIGLGAYVYGVVHDVRSGARNARARVVPRADGRGAAVRVRI